MITIEDDVYNHYEKTEEKQTSLSLIDITMYQFHSHFEMQRFFLDTYLILYVTKGSLNISVDKTSLEIKEKELVLLPPYRLVQESHSGSENPETVFYSLEFACGRFIFFDIKDYIHLKNGGITEPLMTELYAYYKSNGSVNYFKDAKLLMIIGAVSDLINPKSENQQLAEKIHNYINTNLIRNISIQSISDELKYNRDYLCRVFKKEYGMSITEYINSEKMKTAKRLLFHSDMPVGTIAKTMGWDNTNLFIKFFKYHEKITPTEYRIKSTR